MKHTRYVPCVVVHGVLYFYHRNRRYYRSETVNSYKIAAYTAKETAENICKRDSGLYPQSFVLPLPVVEEMQAIWAKHQDNEQEYYYQYQVIDKFNEMLKENGIDITLNRF